jgi:hypothetical protein
LSSSKHIFEIILRIRLLAIKFQFLLHLPHIAGTHIIQSGVDGLSRGEILLGQLQTPIEELTIFDQSPFERMASLSDWLSTWILTPFRATEPEDWFYNAHQSDTIYLPANTETWVWNLHPGAALDALDELGQARLKRHEILMGVVIIPKSLRPEWFRRVIKIVYLYFFIPAGAIEQWPSNMHEGLTSGLYFPLLINAPYDWNKVPFMGKLGSTLSALYSSDTEMGGNLLLQFWEDRAWIAIMPPRMVRALLLSATWDRLLVYTGSDVTLAPSPNEENDYMQAREGDSLFCPFECDECLLHRITGAPSRR